MSEEREYSEIVISKLKLLSEDFGPVANDKDAKHIIEIAISAIESFQKESASLSANQCLHTIHGDDYGHSYCPRIKELEITAESLRAELQQCRESQRWVPCSERLTDKVRYVLCFFGSEDDRFHEIGFHDGQDWYVIGCGGGAQLASDYSATGVTHWMPLPSPPEQTQD